MSISFTPQHKEEAAKRMKRDSLQVRRLVEHELIEGLETLKQESTEKLEELEKSFNDAINDAKFKEKSDAEREAFFKEKREELKALQNKFLNGAANKRNAVLTRHNATGKQGTMGDIEHMNKMNPEVMAFYILFDYIIHFFRLISAYDYRVLQAEYEQAGKLAYPNNTYMKLYRLVNGEPDKQQPLTAEQISQMIKDDVEGYRDIIRGNRDIRGNNYLVIYPLGSDGKPDHHSNITYTQEMVDSGEISEKQFRMAIRLNGYVPEPIMTDALNRQYASFVEEHHGQEWLNDDLKVILYNSLNPGKNDGHDSGVDDRRLMQLQQQQAADAAKRNAAKPRA